MCDTETRFPLLNISRLRMGIDGKGVTTLVAGAGCPLHCRWCLNKEILAGGEVSYVTAQELYEKVRRDDLYFRATGGGITFGGGEALLQAAFFAPFREICGSEWKLCAETSLAVPRELLVPAAETIDEFIVDCKDMDPLIYRAYTGGDVSMMKENLAYLLERKGAEHIVVRVPLIPDYNSEADREKSITELKRMGVSVLDVFSYVREKPRR